MQNKKVWIDIPNQLAILKSRGLVIDDSNHALHALKNIGYYRLGGYLYPFRQSQNNKKLSIFIKDTNFNDVLNLYSFDRTLRILGFDALEQIEMALRTDIAHTLGKRHPNAHEQSIYLDNKFCTIQPNQSKSKHDIWLDKYRVLLKNNQKQDFINHYLNNYQTLPIWVAREILDFGALSHLYGGLKYKDRQSIAKKYKTTPELLSQWLKSLNFIRNVIAHHGRLWNLKIINRTNFKKSFTNDNLATYLDKNLPFAYFYLMAYLLSIINPNSDWKTRLIQHINHFPTPYNQAITVVDFGYLSAFRQYGW